MNDKRKGTRRGFTLLEWVYLIVAVAIIGNEQIVEQSFTLTELGLVTFFIGLLAASVADRTGTTGPGEALRALTDLVRAIRGNGQNP